MTEGDAGVGLASHLVLWRGLNYPITGTVGVGLPILYHLIVPRLLGITLKQVCTSHKNCLSGYDWFHEISVYINHFIPLS